MKNILFLLLGIGISFFSLSQDTIRIKHTNYTTIFDKTKKYPVFVEWWVTKKMVSCPNPLKRKDNFKPDPKLPVETDLSEDYLKSGYDRGHLMPAADNLCQTQEIQDECFYFSNMSAQQGSLNRGDWKSLETWVREKTKNTDSIKVWAGNFGEIGKIGRVSIPEYCWKVIFIKKTNAFLAFLFKNDSSNTDGFENNKVKLEKIIQLTGFQFR